MIYVYLCPSCNNEFEKGRSIDERDLPCKCSNCGVEGKMERVMQPLNVGKKKKGQLYK